MKGRWIVLLLVVGVALDLIISLALIYQNRQIEHAASSAHISRVAAYQSCVDGNAFRKADSDRWTAIVKLLSMQGSSPELTKFVEGVAAANALSDQPRDCLLVVP